MTIHILLIDDEPSLVGVLRPVLAAAGYRVTTAIDGASGALAAAHDSPDVVLLDLGLPDMDGKEVIRGILARCKSAIIVISARHQESEKIAALDEGADDYVNKPFEIGELMARIRAAVRRRSSPVADLVSYQSGPLAIEFATRKVTLSGEQIKLSPKEYELLQTLALNAGQVVTHKRLLAAGWGTGTTDAQYLRVYIGMLRQKIEEDPGDPQLLLTEPGVGYRLAANA
ncbi:response regulator transcription factor [Sphingomonas sp. AR_OL41]|uniref:response regulator transcription factor n=1 Tax=Sphingomonas sp. AR_OL41 TaxID=3042729 RepID=UPI0024818BC9|nr:response regulator transcription factor [Sphingomonas sp. AR_OL41]MDH7975017.1 response regulator transcription factor [Sphingomonas sp. AR_OL41]